MFTARRTREIAWGDCDPAGIVFNPRYFEFFDAATAGLFEAALGVAKIGWGEAFGVIGIPMVETRARFLKPCRYGDTVEIESEIIGLGRSSIKIEHQLRHRNALAVEGFETRVWAGRDPDDPQGLRSVEISEEIRAKLAADGSN